MFFHLLVLVVTFSNCSFLLYFLVILYCFFLTSKSVDFRPCVVLLYRQFIIMYKYYYYYFIYSFTHAVVPLAVLRTTFFFSTLHSTPFYPTSLNSYMLCSYKFLWWLIRVFFLFSSFFVLFLFLFLSFCCLFVCFFTSSSLPSIWMPWDLFLSDRGDVFTTTQNIFTMPFKYVYSSIFILVRLNTLCPSLSILLHCFPCYDIHKQRPHFGHSTENDGNNIVLNIMLFPEFLFLFPSSRLAYFCFFLLDSSLRSSSSCLDFLALLACFLSFFLHVVMPSLCSIHPFHSSPLSFPFLYLLFSSSLSSPLCSSYQLTHCPMKQYSIDFTLPPDILLWIRPSL